MDRHDRWQLMRTLIDLQSSLTRRAQATDATLGVVVVALVALVPWLLGNANSDIASATLYHPPRPLYERVFAITLGTAVMVLQRKRGALR